MSALVFIIVILMFIYLQSLLYEKYALKKLHIERAFEEQGLFPGETTDYKVTVINRKLLPLTWLSIDERLPNALEIEDSQMIEPCSETSFLHKIVITMLPYQRVKRGYRVKCLKRGYYQIKDIKVSTTNLFGSNIYEQEKTALNCIAVYPNIRELGDEFIPANTLIGDFSINRWIIDDPMMITGVRDYQNNDSFKSINWKQTAKNQKMLVNKYDYTADKKITIIFNIDRPEYMLHADEVQLLEEAIELGASLGVKLIESGIPTGIATNAVCIGEESNGILEPDTGKEHIVEMLTVFSQISYMKKYQSRDVLKLLIKNFSWGTEIIVITLSATEELMADLEALGNIKTTVIAFKEEQCRYIPQNVSLYYHKGKDGDKYEAV